MEEKRYTLDEIANAYAKWNVCEGCPKGKKGCEQEFCLFDEEYEHFLGILEEAVDRYVNV